MKIERLMLLQVKDSIDIKIETQSTIDTRDTGTDHH